MRRDTNQSKKPVLLRRRSVIAEILDRRGDALIVAGLGAPAFDCAAVGDSASTFYLWGGMGLAASTGLGLAIAQPRRRVLVVTGDGEMLMGFGSLATIAAVRPRNLAILVLDNQAFGETGYQPGLTAAGVDLAAAARGAGFAKTLTVAGARAAKGLPDFLFGVPGPVMAVVKVAITPDPLVLPPRDGVYLKHRFRGSLLGSNHLDG
jgi:thiamine pyrophosphate-dependent acetolactate synthase large subunit-like protein